MENVLTDNVHHAELGNFSLGNPSTALQIEHHETLFCIKNKYQKIGDTQIHQAIEAEFRVSFAEKYKNDLVSIK